jgi:hypothetical protein
MKRKPQGFLPWVRVGGEVPEGGRKRGFALDDKRLGTGIDEGWSGFGRGGEWPRHRGLL